MQWVWMWDAYWRLWPSIMRIKLKQDAWLRSKISLLDDIQPSDAISETTQNDLALQMHESVRLAARLHFLNADCLPKSIVLADMLRRRSYRARVLVGVSKNGNGIASHAWVELEGAMLAEPASVEHDFTPLSR